MKGRFREILTTFMKIIFFYVTGGEKNNAADLWPGRTLRSAAADADYGSRKHVYSGA